MKKKTQPPWKLFLTNQWHLILAFFFLMVLHAWYLIHTSYSVREHDSGGHIEYIKYMATHSSVPHAKEGWEFFQPPLYYLLGGAWMHFVSLFYRSADLAILDIQRGSLLLSALSLCFLGWISSILFKGKSRRIESFLFVLVAGVIPAFVFFSARINNDSLVQFWCFAALALVIAWWEKPTDSTYWYAAVVCIALGMLTKMNAAIMVPVLFSCLFLHPLLTLQKKWSTALVSFCVLLACTGWYAGFRVADTGGTSLVSNAGSVTQALHFENHIQDFLIFNPIQVVVKPYNNGWDDTHRRSFFWEYLFRSMFGGEYDSGQAHIAISKALNMAALLLSSLVVAGIVTSYRRQTKGFVPMAMTMLFFLLGHALFRIQYTFSSSQDARYSIILIAPIAYFAVSAIPKESWLRVLSIDTCVVFTIFSAAFILSLT